MSLKTTTLAAAISTGLYTLVNAYRTFNYIASMGQPHSGNLVNALAGVLAILANGSLVLFLWALYSRQRGE